MTASTKRCPKCLTGIEFTAVPCSQWRGTMGYSVRQYVRGDGITATIPPEPMLSILDDCYIAMQVARAMKPMEVAA